MKATYCLPSGDYNICLSSEELNQLLKTGSIMFHASRVPCTTSRAVWNQKKKDMDILDKKPIFNNLWLHTDEPIADIEAGDHNVQFLRIIIDKEDTNGPKEN